MDGFSLSSRSSDFLSFFGGLEGSHSLFRSSRIVDLIVVDDIALTDFTCVQTRQIIFSFNSLRQFLLRNRLRVRFTLII